MSKELVNLEELMEFVQSSVHRWKTVVLLGDSKKTVTQVSREEGAHRSQISRTLKELSREGLVECTTPEKRKGRLYALTEAGMSVSDELRAWAGAPSLERRVAIVLDELSIPYAKNIRCPPKNCEKIAEFVVLDAELEPQAMVCALDLSGDTSGGLGALLLWIDQWVEEAKEVDVVLVVKGGLEQNVLEGEISLSSGGLFDTVLREKDLSPSKLAECLEVNQSDCSIISKEVKNSG